MLTCKEAARLISEGLDRKLSLRQRMSLRLHLIMCGACSAYRRQVETLNRVVRRRFGQSADDATASDAPVCSDKMKRELCERLRGRIAHENQDDASTDPGKDSQK